ncbi:MAG: preprotein translocase subunit SecG [Gammaproteobacteria bacterium]|nr:preprotein translocase subunit SecG [Gammaproteobacteria bacterium]
MIQGLTVLQVLVAVALIVLVLLQQGRGADAGAAFGSGSSGTLFGARGSASFLSRMTAVLAAVFFANCIALAYLSAHTIERGSVTERFSAPASSQGEPVPAPGTFTSDVPEAPAGGAQPTDVPAVPESGSGQAPETQAPSTQ